MTRGTARAGEPVHVAVIDTGVAPQHPHLTHVDMQGFGVEYREGEVAITSGFRDTVGHGTAIAAAIFRRSGAGRLTAVRALDARLRARHEVIVAALDEAAGRGARVLNLSLVSTSFEAGRRLADAVERVRRQGVIVVAAAPPAGHGWPADLPGVLSAVADPRCPPGASRRVEACARLPGGGECALLRFRTHGHAIPPAGAPRRGNLAGNSLAAANLTALVLGALTEHPGVELDDLVELIARSRGEVT